jgi:molybdate transport system ATP-binding protein
MSVSRNISFGPRARRQDMDKDFHAQIIDMLGLAPLMDRRPAGLSGGEKQRVALARALVSRPDILLLDEPLAALDAARKEEILPYLERLRDQGGIPMLYVSHSVSEVARLATRVVLLKEGRITQFGAVEEVFTSTDAVATLGLRESGAVLRARVTAHHQDGLTELEGARTRLFLPKVKARVGDQVRLRIKASDVMLSLSKPEGISALNVIEGVITEMLEGQGPGVLVRLKSKDAHLIARVTRRSARAMGLVSGQKLFAIMKSVSVAHADIGT